MRTWQAFALRFAQRMLRKRKDDIFTDVGRQVNRVIHHLSLILAFHGQVGSPIIERKLLTERLKTPDAFTFQIQAQAALDENSIIEFLDLQIVEERLMRMDYLVQLLDPQLGNRQFTLQRKVLLFQMANIELQRHINLRDKSWFQSQFLEQGDPHRRGHKSTHISAQPRNFLHNPRTEKCIRVFWHHEDGFNALVQFTIHQSELKFKFEVRYGPESPDHSLPGALFHVIDQQTVKTVGGYVGNRRDHLFHQGDPFGEVKKRTFAFVKCDRDDDAIKKLRGPLNDVQMTVGERIKTPRINDRAHGR